MYKFSVFSAHGDRKIIIEQENDVTWDFYTQLLRLFIDIDYENEIIHFSCSHQMNDGIREKISKLIKAYEEINIQVRKIGKWFDEIQNGEYFYVFPETEFPLDNILYIFGSIELLNSGVTFENLEKEMEEQFTRQKILLSGIFDKYEIIAYSPRKKYTYGNIDKKNRVCKYCGKSMSNGATFHNEAHAIPESLGNKTMISADECDSCNDYFSKTIDVDIYEYLKLFRALYGKKGKKGTPELRFKNETFIKHDGEKAIILQNIHGNEGRIDFSGDSFIIPLELINKVNFMNIYRSLAKYVLAIISDDEINNFPETIKWIMDIKNNGDVINLPPVAMKIDEIYFNEQPILMIYKRKTDDTSLPYMYAELRITIFIFVYIIPFSNKDSISFGEDKDFEKFWQFNKHYAHFKDWVFNKFNLDLAKETIFNMQMSKRIKKPVILLTNRYSDKVLTVVREELPQGFDFISLQKAEKDELVQKAAEADYFLASGRIPIDREVIESAANLKMIQRTGVGTDTIDLKTLKERKIPVYVNSGINATSVAEHTIMLMLAVLRRLNIADAEVKTGRWQKNDTGIECNSLSGKTVGIVGMGNIGKTVVKMLQPFGVNVLYYDLIRLPETEENKLNIQYCELPELLKQIDILSLHCSLTPQTKGFIGASEIASMKQGAIIINTARGQLIDETALAEALKSGHIKGVGLDVLSNEPLINDNPLLNFDNVILTPHVGGLTKEIFRKMIREAFENIKLFETGKLDLIENKKIAMASVTDRYIDDLCELVQFEFPEPVILQAKKCLLDYLGAAFAGAVIIKEKGNVFLDNFDNGDIPVIGFNRKSNLYNAALINGMSAHVAELDDGERFGMFHPGAPVFSALLPAAQKYNIGYTQFLKGIVIGYEAAIRLARALQPALRDKGFHGTGICGTIGAAVAVGVALNFSKKQLKDALSAAAASASGLLEVIKDSSEIKPYNAGIAAQSALNAVLIAKSGFQGPNNMLDGKKGFLSVFTGKYDAKHLFRAENEMPLIMNIYMKPYAACRHCHAPIEAALRLREQYNLKEQDIQTVNVKTYRRAVEGHDHTEIAGINSAKMSVPFSVAAALITGKAGIQEFMPESIKNESVLALTKKVKVFSDDNLTALEPDKRAAIVEVIKANGECLAERIDYPKGEPETPMSINDIEEKFFSLLSFAGKERTVSENIIKYVRNIETGLNNLLQAV